MRIRKGLNNKEYITAILSDIPGLFSVSFCIFKQALQFLQQKMWKNVHPVYGAGIRTHNLQDMSILP